MNKKRTMFVVEAGVIAAVYVVLTMISAMFGLSSGVIQVRISEAISFLPFVTPAAIPGLTIGCLISNAMAGGVPLDIIFGSVATLLGSICAWLMGKLFKKRKTLGMILATIPNVISNALIVPWVLKIAYGAQDAVWFMMVTVGIGEIIASVILGIVVIFALKDKLKFLNKEQ
ncbi:MAG: QueT transporter family protein [Clostridia bacterium]|nr:QueT transporter family protein [Clostridia bacterium]